MSSESVCRFNASGTASTCQSVPREYLVVDPKRVQARVNGFGVNANIPGVEVWLEPQTNVRRKF